MPTRRANRQRPVEGARPASRVPSHIASSGCRAGNRRCRQWDARRGRGSSSIDWRSPSRVAGAQSRLKSSSTKREAIGHPAVEAAIRGDVVEGQGQLALSRPKPGAKQPVERDRTANLVTMGERCDENVRSRYAAVECRNVFDPGIAGSVRLDVGRGQLDRIIRLGHAMLRSEGKTPILHACACRVTPERRRNLPGGRPVRKFARWQKRTAPSHQETSLPTSAWRSPGCCGAATLKRGRCRWCSTRRTAGRAIPKISNSAARSTFCAPPRIPMSTNSTVPHRHSARH